MSCHDGFRTYLWAHASTTSSAREACDMHRNTIAAAIATRVIGIMRVPRFDEDEAVRSLQHHSCRGATGLAVDMSSEIHSQRALRYFAGCAFSRTMRETTHMTAARRSFFRAEHVVGLQGGSSRIQMGPHGMT